MKQTDHNILQVGSLWESNHYGTMEVISYQNSKNVRIKFLNTSNVYDTNKDNIQKGLVQDVFERYNQFYERERKRKEKWKETLEKREQARQAIQSKKEANEKAKQEAKLLKFQQQESKFKGKRFTDQLGHEFEVVALVHSKIWRVRYIETGNQYTVKEGFLIRGVGALDRDREDFNELYKELTRRKAVEWYEQNRDKAIAKASQYQKVNRDRSITRNRNRRARKLQAEGSHTFEETIELLLQQNYKCNCCHTDITDKRHLDHIMPLALGGSNYIENLQWLCPFCNVAKSAKHPDEWNTYRVSDEFQARLSSRQLIN